jgi:hypothetical protein
LPFICRSTDFRRQCRELADELGHSSTAGIACCAQGHSRSCKPRDIDPAERGKFAHPEFG